MKYLFDQNISHRILKMIPEKYSDSTTVKNENLVNATDREIWEFAKSNDFVIVTQDSDFNDLNALFGFPPKIIWIRTGNLPTKSLLHILSNRAEEIETFISDKDYGCFEIFKI